ncbi:MAG: FG-GAP repeat protein, partial [Planctomycetaceae bacterium]|nr:FG-GAP repeat protein [Planctomycetaceae bacterium]
MLLTPWLRLFTARLSYVRRFRPRGTTRHSQPLAYERLEERTLLSAPNPLELSALNGSNGFVIPGVDSSDMSGYSVSGAGDFNGDGFDDFIIGAPDANPGTDPFAGESYLIFGKASGFPTTFLIGDLDGTNGFLIPGIDNYDGSGRAVSGAGDVNGDGFDDLIIGASRATNDTGEVYVLFGQAGPFSSGFDLSAMDG